MKGLVVVLSFASGVAGRSLQFAFFLLLPWPCWYKFVARMRFSQDRDRQRLPRKARRTAVVAVRRGTTVAKFTAPLLVSFVLLRRSGDDEPETNNPAGTETAGGFTLMTAAFTTAVL